MSAPRDVSEGGSAHLDPGSAGMAWIWGVVGMATAGLFAVLGGKTQAASVDQAAVLAAVTALIALSGLFVARSLSSLVPRTRLGFAACALLVWLFVAALASGRGWSAWMGEPTNLLGWFTVAGAVVIAAFASSRPVPVRRALAVIAPFVVGGQSAAVLIQAATGNATRGSLPNSTYLGEAILLFLPFLFVEDRALSGLTKSARWALAGTAVIALAASGSRLSALVALVWIAVRLFRAPEIVKRVKAAALAVIVMAVAVAAFTFQPAEMLRSFDMQTLGERPQMWLISARGIAERPLLGYGPDGFIAGASKVITPELAEDGWALVLKPGRTDPHNILVWIAVSSGFVGLALAIWFAAEVVVAWVHGARAGTGSSPAVWAVAASTAVYMTAPAALQVVPLFAVVLGCSLAPHSQRRPSPSWAGAIPASVLALALLLQMANGVSRIPYERTGPDVSPAKAAGAQSLADLWRIDPHLWYLSSLHWGWAANVDRDVAVNQPDLKALQRAVELDERDPFSALELARTLVFYGAPASEIDAAFAEAFYRWPYYPAAHASYGRVLALRGELERAAEEIRIAKIASDEDPDRLADIREAEKLLK